MEKDEELKAERLKADNGCGWLNDSVAQLRPKEEKGKAEGLKAEY